MRPHVKQTINDLAQRISELQNVIRYLQGLDDGPEPEVMNNHVDHLDRINQELAHEEKKPTRCAKPKRESKPDNRQRRKLNSVYVALSTMPEPFSWRELAKLCSVTPKAAQMQIFRANRRGFLEKGGSKGYYRRRLVTPSSPPPVPPRPAEAAPAPGPSPFRVRGLSASLAEACAERDRHRAAGNDRLQEIAQRKVDDLSKRLEQEGAGK